MLVLCAINGCIESGLQWYKLYSETFMEKYFELNPYDICVSDKMVNGKQLINVWYVDKTNVSNMEAKLVEDSINDLENHFGALVVTKLNQHTYWGIYH